MKTWMAGTLTICGAAFLLATAWGVVGLLDSADKVVDQGRLMMASLRGTTMQVHRMAQDAVQNQKTLVEAIDRLSRGAAASMDRMAVSSAAALDRLAARLEKVADALESAVDRTADGVEPVLREAAATVRAVREEVIPNVKDAIAGIRPVLGEACAVLEETRVGIAGISSETQGVVSDLRPILGSTDFVVRQVGAIAESGAAVAKHYENMILHPSLSQRAKGWLQMVLSGFTLWGNAKVIF